MEEGRKVRKESTWMPPSVREDYDQASDTVIAVSPQTLTLSSFLILSSFIPCIEFLPSLLPFSLRGLTRDPGSA